MTTHTQVEVAGIEVDEGIAELLEMLWDHGIKTQFSCQGGLRETAMIMFPSVGDATLFMEGTLRPLNFYGCFSARLTMQLAQPNPDIPGWGLTQYSDPDQRVRASVEWPFQFTEIWKMAWRGEDIEWAEALNLAESIKESAHA